MEKVLQARKLHKCDICGEMIEIGTRYVCDESREPAYGKEKNVGRILSDFFDQTGIKYVRFRYHINCFNRWIKSESGHHALE